MKHSPHSQHPAEHPATEQPTTQEQAVAPEQTTADQPAAGSAAALAQTSVTGWSTAPGQVGRGRPGNLVLAGAGSILAVLTFLGGMAVGHSWDGSSNQQGQFGGPGGGFRGGPGQSNTTGQNGTGQNGTGQNGVGQDGSGIGQGNGTDPGQGSQQG